MNKSIFPWLAVAALFFAAPAAAQDLCNHCNVSEECPLFDHWANCGWGGPGVEWSGNCNPGCNELDCSLYIIYYPSCNPETPEPEPEALEEFLLDLMVTDREVDLHSAAERAGVSRMVFDPTRNVALLYSCSGSELVGQIPLGLEEMARLMATIEEETEAQGDLSSPAG